MSKYPIFSVIGLEIEYMLVDEKTLDIRPQSDLILKACGGEITNEVELGDIIIGNELVLHVIELKNQGPKAISEPIEAHFQHAILKLQPLLKQHGLCLLPTGAHPWMDPHTETKRWPYDNQEIYKQYDAIFDCRGHGWSNLQSMHINLPFSNADEFCKLHNSIRLLLPFIPALAASTPYLDGKSTRLLDSRLSFYESNQKKIPSISGKIIPDYSHSPAEYHERILQPMYRDIAGFDPQKLLQYEWLNSRGAIPKFEYGAIEIRITDSQECVQADIAIARAIFSILKEFNEVVEKYSDSLIETDSLKYIYDQTIKHGLGTLISDKALLSLWQLPRREMKVRDLWVLLIERVSTTLDRSTQLALEHMISYGNLSERLLRARPAPHSKRDLHPLYMKLSDCLLKNELFRTL